MKTLLFLSFPVMAFAAPFIDYGMEARHGDYPSVVKILTLNQDAFHGLQDMGQCTGSQISSSIVITAAHCVTTNPNNYSSVSHTGDVLGRVIVNGKDIGIKVKNSYINPLYPEAQRKYAEVASFRQTNAYYIDMTEKEKIEFDKKMLALAKEMSMHDVAILELAAPQKISPHETAKLECQDSLRPGENVEIAGYGRNLVPGTLNKNSNYQLLHGTNRISNVTNGLYTADNTYSKNQINSGDSGGPLFTKNQMNKVYGISVFRVPENEHKRPESVFVRLSSPSSKNFFKKIYRSKEISNAVKSSIKECIL